MHTASCTEEDNDDCILLTVNYFHTVVKHRNKKKLKLKYTSNGLNVFLLQYLSIKDRMNKFPYAIKTN
jgi:hypothetical protein